MKTLYIGNFGIYKTSNKEGIVHIIRLNNNISCIPFVNTFINFIAINGGNVQSNGQTPSYYLWINEHSAWIKITPEEDVDTLINLFKNFYNDYNNSNKILQID